MKYFAAFSLLLAVALQAAPTNLTGSTDAPTTAVPPCSMGNKTNPMIYWDKSNILNPAKVAVAHSECVCNQATEASTAAPTEGPCPEGWINYQSSCYWYSDKLSSMQDAVDECQFKQATLFVANTKEEWNHIASEKNKNLFSWIGLTKENKEVDPQWQTKDAIEVNQLPLLIKDNADLTLNGWNSLSRCAASYNTAIEAAKYVYFYPCDYSFNYICERNATIYHNYPCFKMRFHRFEDEPMDFGFDNEGFVWAQDDESSDDEDWWPFPLDTIEEESDEESDVLLDPMHVNAATALYGRMTNL